MRHHGSWKRRAFRGWVLPAGMHIWKCAYYKIQYYESSSFPGVFSFSRSVLLKVSRIASHFMPAWEPSGRHRLAKDFSFFWVFSALGLLGLVCCLDEGFFSFLGFAVAGGLFFFFGLGLALALALVLGFGWLLLGADAVESLGGDGLACFGSEVTGEGASSAASSTSSGFSFASGTAFFLFF